MKKLIAMLLIGFIGFAMSISCYGSATIKTDITHIEKYKPIPLVYINDAISPLVLPQYRSAYPVFYASGTYSEIKIDVIANANSPPELSTRGDTN